MRTLLTCLLLVACCLAAPILGQPQARPGDTFVEQIDVNIVNLTVNVLDRDGRPVRGLGARDFEVVVDGEPVEISNFFAVDGEIDVDPVRRDRPEPDAEEPAPATEVRAGDTSYVAIFVDNLHIHNKNRRRVFSGIRDYLSQQDDPGTFFMVVTFRADYEVVQPFTNSIGHVVAALDRIEKTAAEGPMHEQNQRLVVRDLAGVDLAPLRSPAGGGSGSRVESQSQYLMQRVRLVAEQTRQNTTSTLGALSYLIGSMSGLPERKTILYLSDGLEMRPAEALLHAHFDRFEQAAEIYNFDRSLDQPALVAQEYDLSKEFEQLAGYAQAHRVILSMIDASGQESNFAGSADARLRDSDSAAVAGYRPVWSNRLDILHTQNRQSTLQLLAEQTGGQVLVNSRDYASFFRTFDERLGVYYSIGFPAAPESEAGRHDVRVKVLRPGLEVRHHRTFVDKTWELRLSEQTLSRVVLGAGANDMEVRALPGDITLQDGKHVLPIHVFVPVDRLSLIPEGNDYVANLAMAVVVKKESGDTNPPQVFVMGLRLPKADVDNDVVKTGEAAVRLVIDSAKQEIGLGVRDQASGSVATTSFSVDPTRTPG